MRALRVESGKVTLRHDVPTPDVPDGEVLLRVRRAGVCDTDIQIVRGYMGFSGTLGHEFVATAETGRFQSQRVVAEINCTCGRCALCNAGLGNHCPNRTVIGILGRDGGFADYISVPERNLHAVPDEVSDDHAVFIEPLAAAFEIPQQIPLDRNLPVAVLGDGKLGNLVAQVLQLHHCRVTVIGKHAVKLRKLESLGITTQLLDISRDCEKFPMVVDCTGSATGLPTALGLIAPRGTVVLKTTVAGRADTSLAPIVIDEITVVGSRCGPFPPPIAALRDRKVDVEPLIQTTLGLQRAPEALEIAAARGATKVLLDPAL